MNIRLPPALEQLVRRKVLSGRYASAAEVLREALRLMDDRDQILAFQKEQVWQTVTQGLEQLASVEGPQRETLLDQVEADLEGLEARILGASHGFMPDPMPTTRRPETIQVAGPEQPEDPEKSNVGKLLGILQLRLASSFPMLSRP